MSLVKALVEADILLVTTEHNALEMQQVLVKRFAVSLEAARSETGAVLAFFDVLPSSTYMPFEAEAARRLRQGGASDWPALAAAIAHDVGVWTEDVDFFGTGVPTWTSANVLCFITSLQEQPPHG